MVGVDFAWGSLSASDCPEWSGLVRAIAEYDGTQELYSAEDLAEELQDPSLDAALDTMAVRTPDGALVAYGQVRRRSELVDGVSLTGVSGGVHPSFRGRRIGRELMDRLEARVQESTAELADVPIVARADAAESAADHRRFLEHRGYRVVRYFHEMVHTLGGIPSLEDTTVVPYRPEMDAAVHDAHTSAFADHWGSAPLSDEEWTTWGPGSRTFRPAVSFVVPGSPGSAGTVPAVADGVIDGYAMTHQWQDGELWIDILGVRRSARRRGLGRELLISVLSAAAEQGYREVGLSVDSDSPSGAARLYTAVGFRVVRTFVAYRRTLHDPQSA